MDYNKKLKTRGIINIVEIIIGIAFIIANLFFKNDALSSFGAVFLVLGSVRLLRRKRMLCKDGMIEKMEIAEKDERNIKIWTEARSLALAVYIVLMAVAIIIFSILDLSVYSTVLSLCLFSFIAIYWVCYFITSKKY